MYASIIFHKDRTGTLRGNYAPTAQFAESTKLVASTDYGVVYSGPKSVEKQSVVSSTAYEPDRNAAYYDAPAHNRTEAIFLTERHETHSYV